MKYFIKKKLKTILIIIFLLSIPFTTLYAQERIYYSEGMNGAVSCGHPLAAQTAIKVLIDGGNAVDAAIAAAFVLGVVDFTNSGIGGEGFALIYHPYKGIIAIDGSTKRPSKCLKNEYDCTISLPAIPEMLIKMKKFYGTKDLKKLLKPAINLCFNGFEVSPYLAHIINNNKNKFKDKNAINLLTVNGNFLQKGQILKQPKLGKTLQTLSKDQGLSFYFGKDSDITLIDMNKKGSSYTKYDFMKYRSKLSKPVKVQFQQYEIFGNPLPSCSIVTIKLALKLISINQPLIQQNISDLLYQSIICRELLNEKYDKLASFFDNTYKFLSYSDSIINKEFAEVDDSYTTHLCVWDKNDMIVSMTLTLGNHFGTGQLAPGGYFYANSLRNYSKYVVNYPEDYPADFGPITTKSPIIVTKNGKPWLALGGAGANRIVTNTAIMLARMIKGYNLTESINEPRFFMDYDNKLILEKSKSIHEKLETIKLLYPYTEIKHELHDFFGLLSAIRKENNIIETVGDKHRDGSCLAY